GTTSGYSPEGRIGIAISPRLKMMTDSTTAKIGRSIKNFEKFMAVISLLDPGRSGFAGLRDQGFHRRRLRVDRGPWEVDLLETANDDLVVRRQSRLHCAESVHRSAKYDVFPLGLITRADDIHILPILIGKNRFII